VLPYFKRMEHNVSGANEFRGQGGPMVISDIREPGRAGARFAISMLQLLDRAPDTGPRPVARLRLQLCVCRPKSRGEIRLADPSGRSMPRIFANYFSDDDDMQRTVAAFHIGRPIIATEPYRAVIFAEVRPAAHVNDEEQIRAYIRQVAGTVYHPCGTCRMGEDERAVVDTDLRVNGIEGMRVVDASVMPRIPSPSIHPATLMVAEKASDVIAKSLVG
jgi:choline dehydrogenase-like flavoprotein